MPNPSVIWPAGITCGHLTLPEGSHTHTASRPGSSPQGTIDVQPNGSSHITLICFHHPDDERTQPRKLDFSTGTAQKRHLWGHRRGPNRSDFSPVPPHPIQLLQGIPQHTYSRGTSTQPSQRPETPLHNPLHGVFFSHTAGPAARSP